MPFAMTKDGSLFFALEHSDAAQFKFVDLIDIQIGWFYFNITFLATVINPLLKIEHANTATKYTVLPSTSTSNSICYKAATNEWITLDKSAYLRVVRYQPFGYDRA